MLTLPMFMPTSLANTGILKSRSGVWPISPGFVLPIIVRCAMGIAIINFPKSKFLMRLKQPPIRSFRGKAPLIMPLVWRWWRLWKAFCGMNTRCSLFRTLMTGEYGLEDVYLSLPCVLSRKGIEQKIVLSLVDRRRSRSPPFRSRS